MLPSFVHSCHDVLLLLLLLSRGSERMSSMSAEEAVAFIRGAAAAFNGHALRFRVSLVVDGEGGSPARGPELLYRPLPGPYVSDHSGRPLMSPPPFVPPPIADATPSAPAPEPPMAPPHRVSLASLSQPTIMQDGDGVTVVRYNEPGQRYVSPPRRPGRDGSLSPRDLSPRRQATPGRPASPGDYHPNYATESVPQPSVGRPRSQPRSRRGDDSIARRPHFSTSMQPRPEPRSTTPQRNLTPRKGRYDHVRSTIQRLRPASPPNGPDRQSFFFETIQRAPGSAHAVSPGGYAYHDGREVQGSANVSRNGIAWIVH